MCLCARIFACVKCISVLPGPGEGRDIEGEMYKAKHSKAKQTRREKRKRKTDKLPRFKKKDEEQKQNKTPRGRKREEGK